MTPRRPRPPISPCWRVLPGPRTSPFSTLGRAALLGAVLHFLKDAFQARWRLFRQIPFPGGGGRGGGMLLTVQEKRPKCPPHTLPFSAPLRDGSVGGVGVPRLFPHLPRWWESNRRGQQESLCFSRWQPSSPGEPQLRGPQLREWHSQCLVLWPAGRLPLSSGHPQ